jgi:hypothetical protein
MDLEGSNYQVSDDAVDQRLRSALSVDPSPDFLARVRARIANEPEPLHWNWRGLFAIGGAIAVAAVVITVTTFQHQNIATPRIVDRAIPETNRLETPREPSQPAVAETREVVVHRQRTRHKTVRLEEPEVLISAREARAFRTLFDAARVGTIDLIPVLVNRPSADAMLQPSQDIPVPAITVPPITIEPLQPITQ